MFFLVIFFYYCQEDRYSLPTIDANNWHAILVSITATKTLYRPLSASKYYCLIWEYWYFGVQLSGLARLEFVFIVQFYFYLSIPNWCLRFMYILQMSYWNLTKYFYNYSNIFPAMILFLFFIRTEPVLLMERFWVPLQLSLCVIEFYIYIYIFLVLSRIFPSRY